MIITAKNKLDKFLENIQGDGFIAKKIRCEYLSNIDGDISNFYTMDNCAFATMGENISLCGNPTQDEVESIMSFCSFLGVYGIETQLDSLPVKMCTTMHLMEYTGHRRPVEATIEKNGSIYSFARFCSDIFQGTAFSYVYPFFARKVNKGISDIYYITENSRIISGAVATKYSENEIYLTFVGTHKTHRRKGLARTIINHIAAENRDKKIILMCEGDMVPFYKKLEFKHTDNIYLYTLREENI